MMSKEELPPLSGGADSDNPTESGALPLPSPASSTPPGDVSAAQTQDAPGAPADATVELPVTDAATAQEPATPAVLPTPAPADATQALPPVTGSAESVPADVSATKPAEGAPANAPALPEQPLPPAVLGVENSVPKKKKHTVLRWAIPVAAVLVLLVAGIGGYLGYYSNKALPGTKLADVSVSGMSRTQVANLLKAKQDELTVEVTGEANAQAKLADLGMQIDIEKTVSAAFQRNSSWLSSLTAVFSTHKVAPTPVVDEDKLEAFAQKISEGPDKVAVVNPKIAFNAEKGEFVTSPGRTGRGIDPGVVGKAGHQAVAELKNATTNVKYQDVPPILSDEQARKLARDADGFLNAKVEVSGKTPEDGQKTFTAKREDVGNWITFDFTAKTPVPTVGNAQVKAWVAKTSEEVAVKPVTGLRNISANGQVAATPQKPKDGIKVTNIDPLTEGIVGAVTKKTAFSGSYETAVDKSVWKDRPVAPGAEKMAYPAAEGEKWMEVNLAEHWIIGWEGTKKVLGPVPIVNGAPATPTKTGTYAVERKYDRKTMRGFNADGSPYVTDGVPWSMYYDGGYAVHGAYWRSSFGYAGSGGSHGCVNLPVRAARNFYDWAPIGTVVTLHR